MRKIFDVAMLFLLVAALLGPRSAAQASAPVPSNPGAGLQNPPVKVDPGEFSTVVVVLRDQADVSRVAGANRAERAKNVVRALQDQANRTQPGLRGLLDARLARKLVLAYQPLWIINGFSVTASQAVIEELAQNPDVLAVLPDEIQIVSTGSYAAPEANIAAIQAPALWNMGFTGQGVVVANVDSGVDVSHPDLAARWRGGSNSWFDPYGQHPVTPTDMTGHGTWTMGILLGGDAGGTTIGVAPGAQWIAAKIFNDQGASTVTAIHQAYQWLLDPDGNPDTSDTPQVVNNSWSFANPGCNLTFEPDLQALVSAGILPVFAAGNGGPGSGTSYSPANNPSAFSVGAYDSNGVVWWMSSRGPSSCANSGAVFPDLSAPGVDIYTSGLYGTYSLDSGTSFAAPHVTGGLALLLSAFPGLSTADQENALIHGAVDLGAPGPDYNYGNGGLNLLAAYNWLAGAAPTATPTLAPTDTPTPEPATATPTGTTQPSVTPTASATIAPGATATIAPSATATRTPTATATRTPTATATAAPSATPTFTATATTVPSATATVTATATATASQTPTATATTAPSATPTMTSTTVPTATATRTPTATTVPSATPSFSPTATVTTAPSPTATSSGSILMHVGDLDAAGVVSGSRWNASVTIRVHDANENPLANVTVSGKWTNGTSGSSSCVTNASGYCTVTKTRLSPMRLKVTFNVTNLSRSSWSYQSAGNHDPDGDSNGTSILISY